MSGIRNEIRIHPGSVRKYRKKAVRNLSSSRVEFPVARLEFKAENGRIVDRSTGSTWNILGEATSGPLKGRRLAAITESGVHFAFAWLAFNPDSEVVRTLP